MLLEDIFADLFHLLLVDGILIFMLHSTSGSVRDYSPYIPGKRTIEARTMIWIQINGITPL